MLKPCTSGSARLTDGLFRERALINKAYLKELDVQCLLQNYELEAGMVLPGLQVVEDPSKANLHWGWEAPICQLRGHFLGHWMSAAAMAIASEPDEALSAMLVEVVHRLARCQELNGGQWVGPFPEKYFTMLLKGQYVWSPQYTMHKLIMGLLDTWEWTGNELALGILRNLAAWFAAWTDRAAQENPDAIYSGEQAGMLSVWARAARLTGERVYFTLAQRYSDQGLYRKLDMGEDGLSNDHANASIPLAHGAAEMYRLTGDDLWLRRLKAFWKCAVTDRGMYATTGQNAGEFWIPSQQQARHLGDRNQEFCTVYNMVRTAADLYEFTEDPACLDYIERALYNGFLAQQHAHTGMPTYFLPLSTGAKKRWGSKRHDFWCCHGTMVQAFSVLPSLICYADEDSLHVAQYIPSEVSCLFGGVKVTLTQKSAMKDSNSQLLFDEHGGSSDSRWAFRLEINAEQEICFALALRIPAWAGEGTVISVNGEPVPVKPGDRTAVIRKTWQEDEILVSFESRLAAERLPDQPEMAAFLDGPIVLAGLTGDRNVIRGNISHPEDFLVPRREHVYEVFPWSQNEYETRMQLSNFRMIPLYRVTDEAYTVYFSEEGRP